MSQAQIILVVNVAIFLFVLYRAGSLAYLSYKRQYKTWPIIATLAGLYLILFYCKTSFWLSRPSIHNYLSRRYLSCEILVPQRPAHGIAVELFGNSANQVTDALHVVLTAIAFDTVQNVQRRRWIDKRGSTNRNGGRAC